MRDAPQGNRFESENSGIGAKVMTENEPGSKDELDVISGTTWTDRGVFKMLFGDFCSNSRTLP